MYTALYIKTICIFTDDKCTNKVKHQLRHHNLSHGPISYEHSLTVQHSWPCIQLHSSILVRVLNYLHFLRIHWQCWGCTQRQCRKQEHPLTLLTFMHYNFRCWSYQTNSQRLVESKLEEQPLAAAARDKLKWQLLEYKLKVPQCKLCTYQALLCIRNHPTKMLMFTNMNSWCVVSASLEVSKHVL